MILNPRLLDLFQRCERRSVLESTYHIRRERPVSVFSRILRESILLLSNCADPLEVSARAAGRFMDAARNGLDIPLGVDVYTLALDFAATLKTIIAYMSHMPLLVVQPAPVITLPNGLQWQPLAWVDESGVYHVWHFMPEINAVNSDATMHSWYVAGDWLATGAPMVSHYIAIGSTHGSHRSSPWCRAYKDPTIPGRFRFQKMGGARLSAAWEELYFAGNRDSDPEKWVKIMEEEGIARPLFSHNFLPEPPEPQRTAFLKELEYLHSRILSLPKDWTTLPITRPSCDRPDCPHQQSCYPTTTEDLESTGRYTRLTSR